MSPPAPTANIQGLFANMKRWSVLLGEPPNNVSSRDLRARALARVARTGHGREREDTLYQPSKCPHCVFTRFERRSGACGGGRGFALQARRAPARARALRGSIERRTRSCASRAPADWSLGPGPPIRPDDVPGPAKYGIMFRFSRARRRSPAQEQSDARGASVRAT